MKSKNAVPSHGCLTYEDSDPGIVLDGGHEDAVIEHGGQLRVRQRQRPQPQVAGSVADSSQHKLDGVDHLQHNSPCLLRDSSHKQTIRMLPKSEIACRKA